MQVTPRFKSYKILEKIFIIKDDTNTSFYLTTIEATLRDSSTEIVIKPYTFRTVISDVPTIWNNKVVSFQENLFWNSKQREELIRLEIDNLVIEEVLNGEHYIFSEGFPKEKDYKLKTTFILKNK